MIERRLIVKSAEVRAVEKDGQKRLTGYAIRFRKWSGPINAKNGTFREMMMPGCTSRLAKTGYRGTMALWNHNTDFPLGATANGSLKLTEDAKGLRYDVLLNESRTAQDCWENVRSGVVRGSSFGFGLKPGTDDQWRVMADDELVALDDDQLLDDAQEDEDEYEDEDDDGRTVVRFVHNIRMLQDVSPVSFPAYPSSSVAARSGLVIPDRKTFTPGGHIVKPEAQAPVTTASSPDDDDLLTIMLG